MDYQIIFSPDLELSASKFAKKWNSMEPFNGLAVARLEEPECTDRSFQEFMATLSSIPIGLSKDTLHDAIATFFKKRGNPVKVKFILLGQIDGSIIVTKKLGHESADEKAQANNYE